MYLENLCIDAHDPRALGEFWSALLGAGPTLTDEPDAFETRLVVPDGLVLDLCFQAVPEPVAPGPRLHLDVRGGARQAEVVQRALALGARHLDIGQHDVPWVVLADPEGNPFCVMEDRPEYSPSGPIAALPLDSADPDRDAAFWAELSGWQPVSSAMPAALRHPSGHGVLLELCPEASPKDPHAKNRLTSTSGSSRRTTRTPWWPGWSSWVAASCTRRGGSCRGGSSPTPRATSSACCRPGRPELSGNPFGAPAPPP